MIYILIKPIFNTKCWVAKRPAVFLPTWRAWVQVPLASVFYKLRYGNDKSGCYKLVITTTIATTIIVVKTSIMATKIVVAKSSFIGNDNSCCGPINNSSDNSCYENITNDSEKYRCKKFIYGS